MRLRYLYLNIILIYSAVKAIKNSDLVDILDYEPYSVLKREKLIGLFAFDSKNEFISVVPFNSPIENRYFN
jgi:hypothetical protein